MDAQTMTGSNSMSAAEQSHAPSYLPALLVVLLFGVPAIGLALYYGVARLRRRRSESQNANFVTIEDTEKAPRARSLDSKWSLNVPKWTSQAAATRRGSDGGFPPETRHISLSDPTMATSKTSLDTKAPPSPRLFVISPTTMRYPTPPPIAAHRPDGHRFSRGY